MERILGYVALPVSSVARGWPEGSAFETNGQGQDKREPIPLDEKN